MTLSPQFIPSFTHPLTDVYKLEKASSVLSDEVIAFFAGHPNSFATLDPGKKIVVNGDGPNSALQKLVSLKVPAAILMVQAEMLKTIAPTKSEWEEDRLEAKNHGREPKFNGFDGVRLNILDCYDEDGILHISIAKSTYTLRAAAAKVASEIQQGKRPIEDLIVDGQIFQPAEFHAGAIMFTSEGLMVTQVKGLADGSGKMHLHLAGGGVEEHHVQQVIPKALEEVKQPTVKDAVAEGLNAEIEEEVGNVRKFGLKAERLGISYERVSLGVDSGHAITNYQGIIHELKSDEGRISVEQMEEIADAQFKSLSIKFRDIESKKGLEAITSGNEYVQQSDLDLAQLWEVSGYPLVDFNNQAAFSIRDGELFIKADVIRPKFNDTGDYVGTERVREELAVQGTIAPQIVYYAQVWEENFK